MVLQLLQIKPILLVSLWTIVVDHIIYMMPLTIVKVTCLKLEDITCGFEKPCIIDIKIGKRVWDDHALQDKIDREKKKYPCQEVIGFRIVGMRVSGLC